MRWSWFDIVCCLHIWIWVFVVFAFVNKKAATVNLYILIPLIFFLHILPFHVLVRLKEHLEPEETDMKVKQYEQENAISHAFLNLKQCFDGSFMNPLSPQGLLVLGAILSAWALKFDRFLL